MLCEWLLYCSCVVTVIQLYVAQCYVGGYYVDRVSSQACSCMQLTKTLPLHGGNYGLCTTAVTLSQTAYFPRTVRAVCTTSRPSLFDSEMLWHFAMFKETYRFLTALGTDYLWCICIKYGRKLLKYLGARI